MSNDRIITAIGRIERALSRVETAINNSASYAGLEGPDSALEARHLALKEEMKQAIRTIDSLIKQQEQ